MAVYGMTNGWFGNDDGPLRPSDSFWRDVAAMHRSDADAERAIFDHAFRDDEPLQGMAAAERWQLANKPVRPQHRSDEEEIFRAAFPRFADED